MGGAPRGEGVREGPDDVRLPGDLGEGHRAVLAGLDLVLHGLNYRGQVILRHKGWPPYRCFLPDLAGFKGSFCTGPGPLSYSLAERVGFEPTIQFPVYGTSNAAPSATRPPLLRLEKVDRLLFLTVIFYMSTAITLHP